MDRILIRKLLGSVCDVCIHWHYCELAEKLYEVGCDNFELQRFVECSVPCEQCYLYNIQLCKGSSDQ